MSNFIGYRTHQVIRRHARSHQRRERQSMEMLGSVIGSIGWVVFAGLLGVAFADSLTGLDTLAQFINWLRG